MLKCKECGFDVELDEAGNWVHKRGDGTSCWHKAAIAPLWPPLTELVDKYNAAAAERATAALDISRWEKKVNDARARHGKASAQCDLLTVYISEHPES